MGLRDRFRWQRIRRLGLNSREQHDLEQEITRELRRAARDDDHYPETDTPEEQR